MSLGAAHRRTLLFNHYHNHFFDREVTQKPEPKLSHINTPINLNSSLGWYLAIQHQTQTSL